MSDHVSTSLVQVYGFPYIIWMVSTSAKVWVPFSTFLYGSDMTQHWRIAGLEPTQVVGLLAVAWMILVTVVASKGINKLPALLRWAVLQ